MKHNAAYAFFYGVSFAVCFLTRVTNGVTICAGTMVIGVILIKNQKYCDLIKNAIGFSVGIFLGISPFALYFANESIFGEFLYGTIGFNIEYQKAMEPWIFSAGLKEWVEFLLVYSPYCMILLTIFLLLRTRKYVLAVYSIVCFVLESYLFFSGAGFWQYAMIAVPQVTLLLNEIWALREKRKIYGLWVSLILCGVLMIGGKTIYNITNMYQLYHLKGENEYQKLLEMMPEEERNAFVTYGGGFADKQIYLLNDILPCEKYFILQEWHAGFSENIKQDIHSEYAECKAEWILTRDSTETIQDILDKEYELIASEDEYKLYHRKDLYLEDRIEK